MTARAARYVVVGLRRGVECWSEVGPDFVDREAAIERARRLLDDGTLRAASVQSRGTPERPTPAGETQVYRGVAAGYAHRAFWPLDPFVGDEVKVRTARRARSGA